MSIENRTEEYANQLCEFKSKDLYYFGSRHNNIKHAQLRMHCSRLNYHLFLLHVTDFPACLCSHYLLYCPLYVRDRNVMLNSISSVIPIGQITVETLLYGLSDLSFKNNCKIFEAVHQFIADTDRL